MQMNDQIDVLIKAGWRVLQSDFSEVAFGRWRKEALECVTLLYGPDHPYTDYFKSRIPEPEPGNVLAGVGVLTAAGLGALAGRA